MAEKKDYVTRKVKTASGEVVEVKLKPVSTSKKAGVDATAIPQKHVKPE